MNDNKNKYKNIKVVLRNLQDEIIFKIIKYFLEKIRKFKILNITKDGFSYDYNWEDKNSKTIQSNFEFPNYIQPFFTAATKNQFNNNANINDLDDSNKSIINNGFNYIFDYLKRSIFVRFKNKKLITFLPFSNNNYINEWSNLIKLENKNKKYGSVIDYLKRFQSISRNMEYIPEIDKWHTNNCIFNNRQYSENEPNKNLVGLQKTYGFHPIVYYKFFKKIEKKIQGDKYFFVNYRDFPLKRIDGKHPYNFIYNEEKSNKVITRGIIPTIFSQSKTDKYADVLVPTLDDIKYFLSSSKLRTNPSGKDWEKKKPIAIFRGQLSGCGTNRKNNQRINAVLLSEEDNYKHVDAKMTNLNKRLKKCGKYVKIINPPVNLRTNQGTVLKYDYAQLNKNRCSSDDQSFYRYILHIQGHVSAFRLSREFSYGSIILKVKSNYELWFEHKLIKAKLIIENNEIVNIRNPSSAHYIEVKKDLSDLIKIIEFCNKKENEEKCKKIAKNSVKFFKEYLSKKCIKNFWINAINQSYYDRTHF